MKKHRTIIFILVLIAVYIIPINSNKHASTLFPDVKQHREEIIYLHEKGIIKGYSNGNFGTNDTIKRVHAVQMIVRELGINTTNAPNPHYIDVPKGSYGYNEIAKATELGIISGTGNGKFDPNGILTRGQMAKILVNAYKLKGQYPYEFTDVSMDHMFYPSIQTLASHYITVGTPDGSFKPKEPLKRAHFAAFLARILNDQFLPYPDSIYNTETMANFEQSVVLIELYNENNELVSQGSGFIVANQLIATNFHVISGGVKAIATTHNGEEIELEGVVEYDDFLDIALLKPIKKIGYPALPLMNFKEVKTGEKVVALGSPYGMQNTITEGIVSSKQTFEDALGTVEAIQTSAMITFGSSGGPLMNMKGFVVGINSFGMEEMNFAIATDYISQLLNPYKNVNFNSIATEAISDMPLMEIEDEEPNYGDDTLPNPSTKLLPGEKSTISELFVDTVHDAELPIIYAINIYGDVIAFNYETKTKKSLTFDYPAESIYITNGKLFITLLKGDHSSYWWEEEQEGAVAIVDASTFKTISIFDILIDPYDIVADDEYFYVSSGSGQWTYIKSYSINSGIEVSTQSIRQQSNIFLHPSKNRIYAVDSDSSPRDMEVFPIQNGVISSGVDSPYHGDFELIPYMVISPDGKYIFNNYGTIFLSSRLRATDMTFVTDIETGFYDVAFNDELTKFYLSVEDYIYVYDYENFTPLNSYSLVGEGYFLFNHNGNLIVVGEELSPRTGLYNTYVLKATMD